MYLLPSKAPTAAFATAATAGHPDGHETTYPPGPESSTETLQAKPRNGFYSMLKCIEGQIPSNHTQAQNASPKYWRVQNSPAMHFLQVLAGSRRIIHGTAHFQKYWRIPRAHSEHTPDAFPLVLLRLRICNKSCPCTECRLRWIGSLSGDSLYT